jgi:hypothetical protein
MNRKQRRMLILLAGLVAVVAVAVFATVNRGEDPAEAGSASDDITAPTLTAQPTAAASATGVAGASTSTSADDAAATPPAASTGEVPAGTAGVAVALSYADWDQAGDRIEASGFVPEVVEAGGVCTLSLDRGGRNVKATTAAEPDATTTTCGLLTVAGAQLEAGTWTATLSYRSTKSQGTSQSATVTVPTR